MLTFAIYASNLSSPKATNKITDIIRYFLPPFLNISKGENRSNQNSALLDFLKNL